MKFICQIYLLVILLGIQLIAASCRESFRGPNSNEQSSTTQVSPVDICTSREDLANSDGKLIKIRGSVTGYHEFALFGRSCPSTANLYELRMSNQLRDELLGQTRLSYPNTTDAQGTVTISGRLIKGGGKLTGYPPRVIDPANPLKAMEPLIVDRIDVVSIDEYQPD